MTFKNFVANKDFGVIGAGCCYLHLQQQAALVFYIVGISFQSKY